MAIFLEIVEEIKQNLKIVSINYNRNACAFSVINCHPNYLLFKN